MQDGVERALDDRCTHGGSRLVADRHLQGGRVCPHDAGGDTRGSGLAHLVGEIFLRCMRVADIGELAQALLVDGIGLQDVAKRAEESLVERDRC